MGFGAPAGPDRGPWGWQRLWGPAGAAWEGEADAAVMGHVQGLWACGGLRGGPVGLSEAKRTQTQVVREVK